MTDSSLIPVEPDAVEVKVLCHDCVREKNAPSWSGRGWTSGERYEDVEFLAGFPLRREFATVESPHGHEHALVRLGTERAENFGFVLPSAQSTPAYSRAYRVVFEQDGLRREVVLETGGAAIVRNQVLSSADWPNWDGPRVKIVKVTHSESPEDAGTIVAELAEHLKHA